jgi:ligand-binding sensor domain-containing protein/putative methionine-R-sulfoxide reductase with GAF domain/two-component sensor histidine kinase
MLFFIWQLTCFSRSVDAQTVFQNIGRHDGLSAKNVRCLYKDAQGMLWIGTSNGLNRYDGAVVKQFPQASKQRSNYVNAIHQFTGHDTLLLGLRDGVLLFDKRSGHFMTDPRFAKLARQGVLSIKSDNQNRIWILTASNIFVFDKGRLSPASSVIRFPVGFETSQNGFSAMVWDTTRNGFWIAGDRPSFLDCKKGQVYFKGHNPLKSPLLEAEFVQSIAVDKRGNVWYGCYADPSLNYWDFRSGKTDTYRELDGKAIGEGCNYLFVDHQDRLWISTWLFAAFLKEPGKAIKKLEYSQDQAYTIAYGHFRDVISDPQGNVWLATINGVSKTLSQSPIEAIYKLPSFPFFLETGFSHANSIYVDGQDIIACKEDGIVIYHTADRSFQRYITDSRNMRDNRFVMAVKAQDGWWFAGHDGIYTLAPGASKLKKFGQIKSGLANRLASFIFTDRQGNVWFNILDDAIYRYDITRKICTRFDGKDPAYGLFDFTNSYGFLALDNHDVLFANSKQGMLRFGAYSQKFSIVTSPALKGQQVYKMIADKDGDIWAAVGTDGLVKIDQQGKLLDSLNSGMGLPHDQVSSMDIDAKGFVWAATREGLISYDPVGKNLSTIDIDLGKTLQDYWNDISVVKGKVYAVMLDHVVVINPLRFAGVPVTAPPAITSVKVFGQEKLNLARGGRLELNPDEDFVTIQFGSQGHRDIPSLQYSYQLEGIDEDWVYVGRSITATYTNLKPGTYRFLIRSTDENDRWMVRATALTLHVLPFWWQTWWFIACCCLLVAGVAYWVWLLYLKRKQKMLLDETLDYFANSVYGENTVNEICWDIARNCIAKLHFEDCVVYLLDKNTGKLLQMAAYGPKSPKDYEIINPIELQVGEGIVGAVAASGLPLLIGDTRKDPRYIVDDQQRLSELAVPIIHESQVIGVIDSEHPEKHFYTPEHLRVVSMIAAISANKIAEAMARAQSQQQEIVLLQINKMLAESQLMALRAQMNPHFVFNCLNSIQECIVRQKFNEASTYLNKFAKLFRLVLNNSGKSLVSVEEEHQVLDLYLQLELMRFEDSFSYQIQIDPSLSDDNVLLPSMLLQPYVENAIWHGLMHKEGQRQMRVGFTKISEEIFVCEVEDNGIGRERSMQFKEQSSNTRGHESKGLRICQDRIDLLARQGNHAKIEIIDNYGPLGEPSGTLVRIELSTYLNNN